MKKLIFILALVISLWSCEKEEPIKVKYNTTYKVHFGDHNTLVNYKLADGTTKTIRLDDAVLNTTIEDVPSGSNVEIEVSSSVAVHVVMSTTKDGKEINFQDIDKIKYVKLSYRIP